MWLISDSNIKWNYFNLVSLNNNQNGNMYCHIILS